MDEDRPVVVVIPAYNEEKRIERAIRLLRNTDVKMQIIVVDDGSQDRTAKIAERLGVRIIRFQAKKGEKIEVLDENRQRIGYRRARKGEPVNRGKMAAFLAGIKAASRLNAIATIIVDADIIDVPRRDFQDLVGYTKEGTHRRKSTMVIGGQIEGKKDFYP